MGYKKALGKLVDRVFPSLATQYRTGRDVKLTQNYPTRVTPFGFTFTGPEEMQLGIHEPEELEFIQKTMDQYDLFIDIGANAGIYTCIARQLGKQAVAIEPIDHNLSLLYQNLLANGWEDTEVWPIGLSDKAELLYIYGGLQGASMVPGWGGYLSGEKAYRRVIPTNTLDALLGHRFDHHTLFIKIDVEGMEWNVLKGAMDTLNRPTKPVWLIEITRVMHHPEQNLHYMETFRLFFDQGYRCFTADSQQSEVDKDRISSWMKLDHDPCYNFIFTSD